MRRTIRKKPFQDAPLNITVQSTDKGWKTKAVGLITRFFTGLGVLFFIMLIGYGGLLLHLFQSQTPTVPDEFVLTMEFSGALPESDRVAGLGFGPVQPSLQTMLETLETARRDSAVKGIVARISANQYSMAQLYDLRGAIKRFRESGKFTYVISDSYGEDGNGMSEYLLASSFEHIWLQPVGTVDISGFNLQSPFIASLLERLNITPAFFQREGYKSMAETFQREGLSPENKEQLQELLNVFVEEYASMVAENRGMDAQTVKDAIKQAPLLDKTAQRLGFVDKVGYVDQLFTEIKTFHDFDNMEEGDYIGVGRYRAARGIQGRAQMDVLPMNDKSEKREASNVAKIVMEGAIMSGRASDQGGPFADTEMTFSRDYVSAIMKAAQDEDIKALLVRINSPGGSPVASESIRRALEYAANVANKPVIITMGSVAASGGYWVATAGDQILVAPTTVTGSIGVVAGKFVVNDLLNNYGVTFDGVQYGPHADLYSPLSPFDEGDAEVMNRYLDNIYDAFLERVAKGRNMSVEQARELAQGRVWAGRAAVENGLADKIGGLHEAKIVIAQALDISADEIVFRNYPETKSPFEQILGMFSGDWAFQMPLSRLLSHLSTQIALAEQPQARTLLMDQGVTP